MSFINPLSVYIVWHPEFIEGKEIAEQLYTALCRDYNKPLTRSLNIPVYFRYMPEPKQDRPADINFGESEYTAIIPLISAELILDKAYKEYLENLLVACNKDATHKRVFPVALAKGAYNLSNHFSSVNFIRAEDFLKDKDQRTSSHIHLKTCIFHELCRMLMHMKKAVEEKEPIDYAPAPVKLFISHSKHDESRQDATKFRDYINSQTQLKTFFDANDIAYGSNFGEEIKKSARESALVVFQSDSYADREWCRIEALTAKMAGCPVVIVNAVQNGEKRTFPYLGNYPSIRLKENFEEIILLTLEQVLLNKFLSKYLDSLTDLYGIQSDALLSGYPELLNFVQFKDKDIKNGRDYNLVLYPDPPLGSEEMNLLNTMDSDFVFITPLMLPSIVLKNGK